MTPTPLRGRWAQGLEPRFFTWIIKDRLGASERPGGFARNHRKVRRQEELIWLRVNNFTRIVSLLDSPHNLHAYEEAELPFVHLPIGRHDEMPDRLRAIYETVAGYLDDENEKLLIHHEEFGDRLLGVLSGYLTYCGLVENGPHAISIMEKLTGRNLGAEGREIVSTTIDEQLVR
jgi:hypothetical protein